MNNPNYTRFDLVNSSRCNAAPEQHSEYRGYTIRAIYDETAENPWESWDCNPPIIIHGNRYHKEYGNLPTIELTRQQVKDNLPEILSMLELASIFETRGSPQYTYPEQRPFYCSHNSIEIINELLEEYFGDLSDRDRLEFLETLYAWKGIPALTTSVSGYSQGDYAELLIVASPEWAEKTGATITAPEQLQPSADLYAAWAFGDIYGYIVEDPEGEEIDSCWGYYGADFNKSGLIDAATGAIDYEIERRMEALT